MRGHVQPLRHRRQVGPPLARRGRRTRLPPALPVRPDRRILARGLLRRGCCGGCWRVDRSVGSDSGRRGRLVPARWRGLALASEQRPLQVRQLGLQLSLPSLRSPQVGLRSVECALELLTASARGPPPDWPSLLAGFRPAHNDRADRPILGWQGGQSKVKCSADIFLPAQRALPDASHPFHRRRPGAPPAAPELLASALSLQTKSAAPLSWFCGRA